MSINFFFNRTSQLQFCCPPPWKFQFYCISSCSIRTFRCKSSLSAHTQLRFCLSFHGKIRWKTLYLTCFSRFHFTFTALYFCSSFFSSEIAWEENQEGTGPQNAERPILDVTSSGGSRSLFFSTSIWAMSRYFEPFLWRPKLRLKCCEIYKIMVYWGRKHRRGDSRVKRNKDGWGWRRLKRIGKNDFEKLSLFFQNK